MLFIIDLNPRGFRNNQPSQDLSTRSQVIPSTQAQESRIDESISLPQAIPWEVADPIHSAESVKNKYQPTTIGHTSFIPEYFEMTSALEGNAGAGNHHICRVTLTGPTGPTPPFSVFNPRTWRNQENTQIQLEIHVGTEACPNWDRANISLSFIRDLVTFHDGYLTEDAIQTLTAYPSAKVVPHATEEAN